MAERSEWNLLKEQFDATMRNDCAREGDLEQLLDHQIRLRFGRAIARAMGQPTDYGSRRENPDR